MNPLSWRKGKRWDLWQEYGSLLRYQYEFLKLPGEHGCVSLDTVNMKVKEKTWKARRHGSTAVFLVPGCVFNVLLSG